MSGPHMSEQEVATMDSLQKLGKSPSLVLKKLQANRAKKGEKGPSKSAVYRFLAGGTYKRGVPEKRGQSSLAKIGDNIDDTVTSEGKHTQMD